MQPKYTALIFPSQHACVVHACSYREHWNSITNLLGHSTCRLPRARAVHRRQSAWRTYCTTAGWLGSEYFARSRAAYDARRAQSVALWNVLYNVIQQDVVMRLRRGASARLQSQETSLQLPRLSCSLQLPVVPCQSSGFPQHCDVRPRTPC